MSINRGMDEDVAHTYNGILLSHNKNEIMAFAATWLDLEITILSEIRQRQTSYAITHVESKKQIQMCFFGE